MVLFFFVPHLRLLLLRLSSSSSSPSPPLLLLLLFLLLLVCYVAPKGTSAAKARAIGFPAGPAPGGAPFKEEERLRTLDPKPPDP